MRKSTTALVALAATAVITIMAPSALAGPDQAARPALANPGDVAPSLSLSVTASGQPEAATVGNGGSLWFYHQVSGHWSRTRIGGTAAVASGPSLTIGSGGAVSIAVQGPGHTLQYYFRTNGHWRHTQAGGRNTTYAAPSVAIGPHGPGIAAQGRNHTLWYYALSNGHWHDAEINGPGTAYSAPSMVIRSSTQADPANPAGQVDIAVQNGSHTLSYYNSLPSGHWQNDVIGTLNSTYSAPSLLVFHGDISRSRDVGVAYVVAQGPNHSLMTYADASGWTRTTILGSGWVYSAPSLTQGSAARPIGIAYRGPSSSVAFIYLSRSGRGWVNDVISAAVGQVSSAPSLFLRFTNPPAENDLIFQGTDHTLWYYHAPNPVSASQAPAFTGSKIAGLGTTYGG